MPTMRDVAMLAGVSDATVSRAFNEPEKVTERTLERVRSAASKLNYTPNMLAASLRQMQSKTIVVIVPDLANAFFSKVLDGIEEVAAKAGLSLLLANSRDELEVERRCVEMVRSRRVDGVIQLGARSLQELVQIKDVHAIPFVHAIEAEQERFSPSVSIDNAQAAAEATSFVIGQGHRRIGVIAGRAESRISQLRLNGIHQAMNEAGIALPENQISYGEYTVHGGEEATGYLLDRASGVSALICMSDEMAIGAMSMLRSRGYEIPRDISVTGFDNIEIGGYLQPTLTTVSQPSRRMGEEAMRLMVAALNGTEDDQALLGRHVVLPTELVVRESVAPPKE